MSSTVEVHVRWAHVDQLTDTHLQLLDDPERRRRERLQRPADRARAALGGVLLRHLVAELDHAEPGDVVLDRACPRCGEQHGPVTVPDRGWRCSVSHSGGVALAAAVPTSQASALGVDVETRCPPDWPHLVTDLLAPDEPAPTDEAGFLALWVRKEAVLKATTRGLSRPMSTVDVTGAVADGLRIVDLDVSLLNSSVGPVAAAVAVGAEPVRLHWQRAAL